MSEKIIDFLKADLDQTKSELKRLDEKLSKLARVVEKPDGSYYCIGDTCVKISELQKDLFNMNNKLREFERKFKEAEKASIGDLIARDDRARKYIENLAMRIANNVVKTHSGLTEAKLKAEIQELLQKELEQKKEVEKQEQPKRSRLYELFIAPREKARKGA